MLQLSRRTHQEIVIGKDIFIQVLGIAGDYVRLGIIAPDDLRILRREVYDRQEQAGTRADERHGRQEGGRR